MPRPSRASPAPWLVALAACGHEPVAPLELSGHGYALVGMGTQRPPIPTAVIQGDTTQLVADTLYFDAAPNATRVLSWRLASAVDVVQTETVRTPTFYRLASGRLQVGRLAPCGIAGYCAPDLVGSATTSQLGLAPENAAASDAARYDRVDGR